MASKPSFTPHWHVHQHNRYTTYSQLLSNKNCAFSLFLNEFFHSIIGAYVGVNIGTDVSNLPPASNTVSILKTNQITHVRLYDADAHMLRALANTGIEVMVGVKNEEVLGISESPATAASWVNKNVAAYLPSTNITAIAVGSEVLTTIPNAAHVLVPAMNYLHKALVASNLNFQVRVSSPQSMDVIPKPFPRQPRFSIRVGIRRFIKFFSF